MMTTLELKLNLPSQLAREAQSAGLLTPESITQLLRDAVRRRAGQTLITAAYQAAEMGGALPSMDSIVADVRAVRAARKKVNRRK